MRFATRFIVFLVGFIVVVELLVLVIFSRQHSHIIPRNVGLPEVVQNQENDQDKPVKQEGVLSPKIVDPPLER